MNSNNQVKQLRLQRAWSQEQLAELTGLSVRTIQRIENGDRPGLETLSALAAVFEVNVAEISGESSAGHEESLDLRIEEAKELSMGEDGNGVDVDAENIALVRTQLQYQAMVQAVSGELSRMSYVLNGGK